MDASFCEAFDVFPSLEWLSPRTSFSRDSILHFTPNPADAKTSNRAKSELDSSVSDFEFAMSVLDTEEALRTTHADELFLEGKMLPFYGPLYVEAPSFLNGEAEVEKKETRLSQYCSRKCNTDKVTPVNVNVDPKEVLQALHPPISPKSSGCYLRCGELLGRKKDNKSQPFYAKPARASTMISMVSRARRLLSKSKDREVAADVQIFGAKTDRDDLHVRQWSGLREIATVDENVIDVGTYRGEAVEITPISDMCRNPGRPNDREINDDVKDGSGGLIAGLDLFPHSNCSSRRGMSCDENHEMKLESHAASREKWYLELSPSRRWSGAASPAGSWSPGGYYVGGWGTLGKVPSCGHASGACGSTGRRSCGESSTDMGSLRSIIDRSNSYSSRRLQWKYEQMMKQRDGRRLLERSWSYNMSSMLVSPILNVPPIAPMRLKNGASRNYGSSSIPTNTRSTDTINKSRCTQDNCRLGIWLFHSKAASRNEPSSGKV